MTTDPRATWLNTAGFEHVEAEIKRLGLNWSTAATCSDVESRISFDGLTEGDVMAYEISNNAAALAGVGRAGYGVYAYIEIKADEHVTFVVAEG